MDRHVFEREERAGAGKLKHAAIGVLQRGVPFSSCICTELKCQTESKEEHLFLRVMKVEEKRLST